MLSGQDVHKSFVASYPYVQPNWDELKSYSQEGYESVARELNSILEGGQMNNLEHVLAVYRSELERQATFILEILVEEYSLVAHDRQECIDALVDHFKQQILKEDK